MKFPIPSFRTQIVLLVLFLVVNSALFFRHYFLDSFQEYATTVERLNADQKIKQLYQDYQAGLEEAERSRFKQDLEEILSTEEQQKLGRGRFEREVALYSKFIFVFVTLAVLILFFFSFNLVTKPLKRLQGATEELSRGNWSIQVRESKFSPLNDLIISFNTMITELETSRNKLVQAEKELAWREMARVLAHEIKNPLTPIRLSLERLEHKYRSRSPDLDDVFDNASAVIHEEVDNLQSLAGEFSQFARLPQAAFSRYNVNDQLNEIIQPYQEQARFSLILEADLPLLYADKSQLKQVFVNLIQNGIQSSDGDRQLTITTRRINRDLAISFEDHGAGITTADLEKIFDPYFSRREKGTGLGLAIVKRIVELHQGTIAVESEIGKGTVFILSLPLDARG